MIADNPQRAIFDDSARYHRFLEYRVCGDAERSRAARAIGSALHAARGSVDRPARIVVAFGRRLWSVLAPDSIPSDLRDFETIQGVDGHVAPATQRDLWVWLQGDGEDENVARALALHSALREEFELALEQPGFTYFESRDLIRLRLRPRTPSDPARTDVRGLRRRTPRSPHRILDHRHRELSVRPRRAGARRGHRFESPVVDS